MAMKYLSEEWLAAANEAVSRLAPAANDVGVGYIVTNAPGGDVAYTLVLGPTTVAVVIGTGSAGVTLTLDWVLAERIFKGEASAQRAFLDGAIRVGGDVQVLVGNNDAMAAVDAELAHLRSQTV